MNKKKPLQKFSLCSTYFISYTRTNLKFYMINSIWLAIIHAFTALWEIKFEQMVVFLNFCQKMNFNDNECKKIILKSWTKLKITAICSIFIFQSAVKAWIIANYIDFTILAIIQAFTALWQIKFEQMAVILSFVQVSSMIFLYSLSFFLQNSKWLPFLKFDLSESCKSVYNSQSYRTYHIDLQIGPSVWLRIGWTTKNFCKGYFCYGYEFVSPFLTLSHL